MKTAIYGTKTAEQSYLALLTLYFVLRFLFED